MVAQTPVEARATSQLTDGSDARLRALTEHALEIITVQGADGTFTYANEAVVRYLGYSVSELLGRNAAEFLHPDDADGDARTVSRVPAARATRSRSSTASNTASVTATAAGAGSRAWPSTRSRIPRCAASSRTRATSAAARRTNAACRSTTRGIDGRRLSEGAVYEYLMNAEGVYELEWTLRHRARLRMQRRGIPPPRLAEFRRRR